MSLIKTESRIFVVLAAFATAGCGTGFSPAEGVVTLDGAPLPDATVVFQAPNRPLATARTDHTGHYTAETGSIRGIKPGKYRVGIAAYREFVEGHDEETAPDLAIPEKYAQPDSSGLTAVIVNGPNRGINFDLTTDEVSSN